jgi:hypothetical protein
VILEQKKGTPKIGKFYYLPVMPEVGPPTPSKLRSLRHSSAYAAGPTDGPGLLSVKVNQTELTLEWFWIWFGLPRPPSLPAYLRTRKGPTSQGRAGRAVRLKAKKSYCKTAVALVKLGNICNCTEEQI